MTTAIIVVLAVFFLGMGAWGLTAPASLVRSFGIVLPGPDARAEVRAVYGGFGVAVAAVLVLGALQPGLRTGVAITVGAALLGMAGGRVVARLFEAPSGFYPSSFYGLVEVVGAALLLVAALG